LLGARISAWKQILNTFVGIDARDLYLVYIAKMCWMTTYTILKPT